VDRWKCQVANRIGPSLSRALDSFPPRGAIAQREFKSSGARTSGPERLRGARCEGALLNRATQHPRDCTANRVARLMNHLIGMLRAIQGENYAGHGSKLECLGLVQFQLRRGCAGSAKARAQNAGSSVHLHNVSPGMGRCRNPLSRLTRI